MYGGMGRGQRRRAVFVYVQRRRPGGTETGVRATFDPMHRLRNVEAPFDHDGQFVLSRGFILTSPLTLSVQLLHRVSHEGVASAGIVAPQHKGEEPLIPKRANQKTSRN